jgi:hypothetical protein
VKYAVRYRGGIEHYDDVLDALPAARAARERDEKNIRVFRCDPNGEVLLQEISDGLGVVGMPVEGQRGEPVDQHSFQDRAQRGLL